MGSNHPGIQALLSSLGSNSINHSRLNSFADYVPSAATYGIKFVAKGKESYIIREKAYVVSDNQFLLINKGQGYYCEVGNKQEVEGFCLNLDERLLQKVHDQMQVSDEQLLNDPGPRKTSPVEFHEAIYHASDIFHKFLLKELHKIRLEKDSSSFDVYNFYYEAAYHLLLSQRFTNSQIQNIKALKNSTRKEIYNRLTIAKSIMDSDLCGQLDISSLARQCGLSEFHFYRSFKEAFGITPHQYLLGKRMTKSMELLSHGNLLIADIAYQTGFTDACSFSKSFKKYFDASPARVRQHHKKLYGK